MDESKTLDLVDVVRARLEGAGIRDVFTYLPDARRHAEFCAIRTGVPGGEDSYFDLAFDTATRLSLFVARRVELDAMGDALLAERTLRTVPLDSANGSYRMIRIETVKPRPVQWDESGRNVWVVEATAHIEIKEL